MEHVCHPEKKKIGTLTWTKLKNHLSQLGSIPAINKTTLKPPNTHICICICIYPMTWGHGILTFSQNTSLKIPSKSHFLNLAFFSEVSSILMSPNWQTTAPSCHLRVWEGKGHLGIFFWSQTGWGVLLNHGNLTNRGDSQTVKESLLYFWRVGILRFPWFNETSWGQAYIIHRSTVV